MKTTDEILELLRQFKSVAGEKYGIEQLALFGSAARGEQREDSGYGQQLFWRVRRLVQKLAEQANADKEKQANQH